MEYDDVSELMIKCENNILIVGNSYSRIDGFLKGILYKILNIMISLRLTVIQIQREMSMLSPLSEMQWIVKSTQLFLIVLGGLI